MSTTAISGSTSPYMSDLGGVGGNDNSQLEQFLESLLPALQQILSQLNGGSSDNGSGGGGVGGVNPGAGAVPSASAPPNNALFNANGGGGSPVAGSGSSAPSGAPNVSGAGAGGSTLGPGFPPQLQPYAQDIQNASQQTGVPANILAAQVWQESRGQAGAASTNVNGMTDQGLMQVDPATFAQLQKEHPALQGQSLSNPATNILAGAYYMADNAKSYPPSSNGQPNWGAALRAYNSGPDQVNLSNLSNCSVGDPNYVTNVLNFANTIQNGGTLPA
jgi:hypothetical protein